MTFRTSSTKPTNLQSRHIKSYECLHQHSKAQLKCSPATECVTYTATAAAASASAAAAAGAAREDGYVC